MTHTKSTPSSGRVKNPVVLYLTGGQSVHLKCLDARKTISKRLAEAQQNGTTATLRTGWNSSITVHGPHLCAFKIGD